MIFARRLGGALACCLSLAIGAAAGAQGISAEDYARLRPQAPREVAVVVRDGAAAPRFRATGSTGSTASASGFWAKRAL